VGAFSTPPYSHHLASRRKELFPPSVADPLYPSVDEPDREPIFFLICKNHGKSKGISKLIPICKVSL
jgi:hypothetical protein